MQKAYQIIDNLRDNYSTNLTLSVDEILSGASDEISAKITNIITDTSYNPTNSHCFKDINSLIQILYSNSKISVHALSGFLREILIKCITEYRTIDITLENYPLTEILDDEFIAIFTEMTTTYQCYNNSPVLDFIARYKPNISAQLLKIRLPFYITLDFTAYAPPSIEILNIICTDKYNRDFILIKLIRNKKITFDALMQLATTNYSNIQHVVDEFISLNEITIEQKVAIAKSKIIYSHNHGDTIDLRGIIQDFNNAPALQLSLIRFIANEDCYNVVEIYADILNVLPDKEVLGIYLDYCLKEEYLPWDINNLSIVKSNPDLKTLAEIFKKFKKQFVSTVNASKFINDINFCLRKALDGMWNTSDRSSHLFSECIQKIAEFKIEEFYDEIKLGNMFKFLMHSIIRVAVNIKSSYIKQMSLRDTKITSAILNEILKYNEPDKRVELAINLIDVVKKDYSTNILWSLIHKQAIHIYIPALLLTRVIMTTDRASYQVVENKVKAILKSIPRDYRDGSKLHTMISGLLSICNTKKLSSLEKIAIIEKILYKNEYELCIGTAVEETQAQELISGWQLKNINDSTKFLLMVVQNPDNIFFSGLTQQGVKICGALNDIPSLNKLATLVYKFKRNLKNSVFRVPVNLKKEWLQEITSSTLFMDKVDINVQKNQFMLCQGLQDCDAMEYLNADHISMYGSDLFHEAYTGAVKDKFGLANYSNKQMKYFWNNFDSCHNPNSLITYYGRLCTLSEQEKDKFLPLLNTFIQQVASKNAGKFYLNRYDEAKNPHLRGVFATDLHLRNKWIKGSVKYNLKRFIQLFNLSCVPAKINFHNFLITKILKHQHLPKVGFEDIHSYLKGKVTVDINLHVRDVMEEKKALLKAKLIELCTASTLPITEQLSLLSNIAKILRGINTKLEFINDVQSLITVLYSQRHSSKIPDVTRWSIVDSDHFWNLFMAGTDVPGSCQRVNGSAGLNKSLIGGYVLSGHIRMLAIVDENNKIQARCMLRLHLDEEANKPVLFMEDIYPEGLNNQLKEALLMLARIRALKLNCTLTNMDATTCSKPYPHPIKVTHINTCEYVDALHSQQTEPYQIEKSNILFQPLWYKNSISNCIRAKQTLKVILPKQALVDLKTKDQGMYILANPWFICYIKKLVTTDKAMLHHDLPKQAILHLKQAYQMGLVRNVYLSQPNSWQQQRQIIAIKLKNADNNVLKFSC